MKRTLATLIPAIILACVVLPFVIAPLISRSANDVELASLSTEELIRQITSNSLLDGEFSSLAEQPRLWKEFCKRIEKLPQDEQQNLIGQFVALSIDRKADSKNDDLDLLISVEALAFVGVEYRRPSVRAVFLNGKHQDINFDDTSLQTGYTGSGPYGRFSFRIDLSQLDEDNQTNLDGAKIVVIPNIWVGGNPALLYEGQVEYPLDEPVTRIE